MKRLVFVLPLYLFLACQNNGGTNTPAGADQGPYATCTFQMMQMQTVQSTPYKAVTAQRYCESTGVASKELVLFAKGEPIDNSKECNVFATTDTAIGIQIQVGPNRVEVLFDRQPDSTTVLMQRQTVYDSIQIVYSVLPPAAS